MQVKELIDMLQKWYKPEDHVAAHLWCAEDILTQANDMEVNITIEQANDILEELSNDIDSEFGITWDGIKSKIKTYLEGADNGN